MSGTYLSLTNKVLARLNEVQLTSSNFSSARGIQVQAQNAVNEAVRFINQREFNYPFNHATATQTLTAGTVRYSLPTSTKTVDYNQYVNSVIDQEDEINSTTTSTTHTNSVTTITVTSTSGFDSAGTLYIGNEQITYTAIGSSTTFTGATRGAGGTTAASILSGVTVAQFDKGGIPQNVVRTPDNNYLLYPYPTKSYSIKFDYYTFPTDMSVHGSTTSIPARFDAVIIDGATAFVYQYRGETQQYQLNMQRFEQGIKNMQTLLINKFSYIRSTYIPRTSTYGNHSIDIRTI